MLASFSDAFHRHFTRHPNRCVELGVDRNLDRLPDPSAAETAVVIAEARGLLRDIDDLERVGGLDFDDALDIDLARIELERELHQHSFGWDGQTTAEAKPHAADDLSDGIFTMMLVDPRPDADRLADVTSRITGVPAYLDAALSRLGRPLARWASIEQEKLAGLPELFATIRAWAEDTRFADQGALNRACSAAEAALSAHSQRLASLPTTTALHVGPETARRIVALRGIDRSLDELHQMAREFLGEIQESVETLRARLCARYGLPADTPAAELHDWLNQRFAVAMPTGQLSDILARYERERGTLLEFCLRDAMFPIPPDQDMKLVRTPGFLEPSIPAGAMMAPAPFRPGTKTSVVYLTLRDDLIDEHTELGIPGMMLHEGIPGHHLQLSHASLHRSIIRRHVDCAHHAEGWTTMLEDYCLDQGLMAERLDPGTGETRDLSDEARFVAKWDIARIGARVGIDLYFMTGEASYLDVQPGVAPPPAGDDPFAPAATVLQQVTGFTPGRVQGELNWYSSERGYPLSYLAGNRLVWSLKADLQAAGVLSGAKLDRAFHRIYLESGNMPLTHLRRVFQHEGLLPRA